MTMQAQQQSTAGRQSRRQLVPKSAGTAIASSRLGFTAGALLFRPVAEGVGSRMQKTPQHFCTMPSARNATQRNNEAESRARETSWAEVRIRKPWTLEGVRSYYKALCPVSGRNRGMLSTIVARRLPL